MSKYIIAFTDCMGRNQEYYKGGSYRYCNEKYAIYGDFQNAKRYASEKLAESSARKLSIGNYANTSRYYKIIKVEE